MPTTVQERRIKRAARREKQRQGNIDRATKMHAARMDREASGETPHHPGDGHGRHLYIGCSGWFYWHRRGAFYPSELPTSGWFKHYASRFKTVELNAPFYSWPTVATVNSWINQAGRREFIYTVKGFRCEVLKELTQAHYKSVLRNRG